MIDLSPALNPARTDAMNQARARANREDQPMYVYVAPPNADAACKSERNIYNIWYVRSASEGVPDNAELIHTQAPER